MELSLTAGKSKTPIYEFAQPGSAASSALYNPDGIEVGYGYDTRKDNDGQLRVFYGGLGNNNNDVVEIEYAGIQHSAGLHNISLSRELAEGEKIIVNWKNGYKLVIYSEEGYKEVAPESGSDPHDLGLYELKLIETEDGSYQKYELTEDTQVQDKTYYEKGLMTKVKKRNGGSYQEAGSWADADGNAEHVALLFDSDMYVKRFDKIKTESFEEIK